MSRVVESHLRERLRARGLRWTPQRRTIVRTLDRFEGHVTGAELVEACRSVDPTTTPSTVYRTLDVLEELGVVSHSHGHDGHEEYHVRPRRDHGHLLCESCGASLELTSADAAPFAAALRERHDFEVALGHLTVVGRCRECRIQPP
jgi:Fur family ferric uptake transcriptional regulator